MRYEVKQFGMYGCRLLKRGYDLVKMGAKWLQKFLQHRIIDLFDQAEKERQLGADACDGMAIPRSCPANVLSATATFWSRVSTQLSLLPHACKLAE